MRINLIGDRRRILVALVAAATGLTPCWAAEPGVGGKEVVIGQNITLQGGKNAYGAAA